MTTIKPTRVVLPIEPRDEDGYQLDPDSIRVRVDGPVEVDANIEQKKGGGGELVVVFSTTKTGQYHVHLTHMGKHIKHSPMLVKVEPKEDASAAAPPPVQLPSKLVSSFPQHILLYYHFYTLRSQLHSNTSPQNLQKHQ